MWWTRRQSLPRTGYRDSRAAALTTEVTAIPNLALTASWGGQILCLKVSHDQVYSSKVTFWIFTLGLRSYEPLLRGVPVFPESFCHGVWQTIAWPCSSIIMHLLTYVSHSWFSASNMNDTHLIWIPKHVRNMGESGLGRLCSTVLRLPRRN
jgi:hypothetical protein